MNLYSPSSSVNGRDLTKDLLGFQQSYIAELSQLNGNHVNFGENGEFYLQILLNVKDDAEINGDDLAFVLQSAAKDLEAKFTGLQVSYTGSIFYSSQIAKTSKVAAVNITAFALVGILLLFLWNFRSVQSIIGATVTIASGIIFGAAAVIAIFDTVHVIAIAFGSSLVGVVIDYAIHFYFTRRASEVATKTAKRIRRGLLLAVLTTCIGFAALFTVDIGILKQISVYAIFGVIGAMTTVLLLIPASKLHMSGKGLDEPSRNLRSWHFRFNKYWYKPCLGIGTGICVIALAFGLVPVNDSVRNLRIKSPELSAHEQDIAKYGGNAMRRTFFIEGNSLEEVLQEEERIIDAIRGKDRFYGVWGVSRILPSLKRQREVCQLRAAVFESNAALPLKQMVPVSTSGCDFIEPSVDLIEDLPPFVKNLILLKSDKGTIGLITHVRSAPVDADLERILKSSAHVSELDIAKDFTQRFQTTREKAVYALLIGIAGISVLFSVLLGPRKGLSIALVPAFSSLASLLICGLLTGGLSLFSVMAAYLVYALGADYALFQQTAESDDRGRTYKAVTMSTVSTLLVFILASISPIPVLQMMGSVIVVGVLIAWLIAPLASNFSVGERA
ncbi:MMPL family transporter [Sneathiella glossodoripedis]|uniref:MMPL family transporter n=1 Tax=Sneathiella glossodoripedis TaxID=418853 RepID=UPI0011DD2DA7|nr:MMPL family transporter [Sneathiella glossodoripedis]